MLNRIHFDNQVETYHLKDYRFYFHIQLDTAQDE